MPLPFIMMAAQALPAIFKSISGANQMAEGKAGLANLDRPEYNMPEEIARALKMSQQAYADPFMPGQGVMTDRAEQQAANAYSQSIEAGNPFAAIANIQSNASGALQNIGTASANYQAQDLNRLMQMLQVTAGYKDTEFQMNEFAPYAEKAQEFRDMWGAGNKNLYGGMDQISGVLGNIGSALLKSQSSGSGSSSGMDADEMKKVMEEIIKKYSTGSTDTNE